MISLATVSKIYNGNRQVVALDRVDLEIGQGEMVSIVGPSGSGKSTMLNLIGGLDRPTSGEIRIDGESLAGLSDDRLTRLRREKNADSQPERVLRNLGGLYSRKARHPNSKTGG